MFALIVVVGMITSVGYSQPSHSWFVVDNGGGPSTAGTVSLRSSFGQAALQSMTASGIKMESGYIAGLKDRADITQSVLDGWNLLSIPRNIADYRKTAIYPAAISSAFSYNGTYIPQDTLPIGMGFWLKFNLPDLVGFSGTVAARETINVQGGWNIIGIATNPVPVGTISTVGTSVVSTYFGYDGPSYYVETILQPGVGYWVRVSQSGQLILQGSGEGISSSSRHQQLQQQESDLATSVVKAQVPSSERAQLRRLIVTDATGRDESLYFAAFDTTIDVNKCQIPPVAPGSQLDVRYATGRTLELSTAAEAKVVPLRITNAVYPIRIRSSADGPADAGSASLMVNGNVKKLGNTDIIIADPEASIRLRLEPAHHRSIPAQFALSQNYPNPFNPSTVINYQLPVNSHVTLKLYDLLGQEIKTLVDEMQDAGYQSVELNAHELASGMYYYRLVAGSYGETRKMLLVK